MFSCVVETLARGPPAFLPVALLQSQGWGQPCSCEGWGSSAASAGHSLLPPCPCPGRSGWATRLLSPADRRFISSNGHLSVIHVCGGKSTLCAPPGHPAPGPVISTSWGRFCQCLPKFPSSTHSCRCCLAFPSRTDPPHCSPFSPSQEFHLLSPHLVSYSPDPAFLLCLLAF